MMLQFLQTSGYAQDFGFFQNLKFFISKSQLLCIPKRAVSWNKDTKTLRGEEKEHLALKTEIHERRGFKKMIYKIKAKRNFKFLQFHF